MTEVNDEMLSELAGRTCPRCSCHESRPVDSADDREMARLPVRVCVACNELFGYDDSTSVPEHRRPHDEEASSFGGRIWNDHPRPSSPCFRNFGCSSGSENRDNDEHHPEYRDPPGRGRGRGGGCERGRGHHHGEDRPEHRHRHRRNHQHHCGGRGHQKQRGSRGSSDESSSSGRDQWNQVASALTGAACSVLTGDYGGAVGSVSDEMEPVGRAVGSALGSVAGNVIGSPRAGEIAAEMGAMVGSGVAEMLKDSSLCNRRSSSHYD